MPIIQSVTTLWFIFATRVGPASSLIYMNHAPEFTYFCGWSCFVIMPIVIIVHNIIFLAKIEEDVSFVSSLSVFMLTL